MEGCKECEKAREDRDKACWDGGNTGHKRARQQVKEQNGNIRKLKDNAINEKEVYYCSKSSYEGAMRAYNSKCRGLNLSKIERAMEKMDDDVDDNDEIDCDDLEEYIEQCEACYDAAQDLISTAFKRSDSYTPSDIVRVKDDAENAQEFGEDLLKKAQKEDLCD